MLLQSWLVSIKSPYSVQSETNTRPCKKVAESLTFGFFLSLYHPFLQAATVEEREHANAPRGHVELQHGNHTHLHLHEHVHSATSSSDSAISRPRGSLGTVANLPAPIRSSPAAAACPGPRAHRVGITKLNLWLVLEQAGWSLVQVWISDHR